MLFPLSITVIVGPFLSQCLWNVCPYVSVFSGSKISRDWRYNNDKFFILLFLKLLFKYSKSFSLCSRGKKILGNEAIKRRELKKKYGN